MIEISEGMPPRGGTCDSWTLGWEPTEQLRTSLADDDDERPCDARCFESRLLAHGVRGGSVTGDC